MKNSKPFAVYTATCSTSSRVYTGLDLVRYIRYALSMKTLKILIAVSAFTLGACGQIPSLPVVPSATPQTSTSTTTLAGPVATPSPTPSASPLPPPTVVSYIFQNSIGICNAVKNWNPATTTIVFPTNSGGGLIYTFAATGIMISNADGSQPGTYTGTITKVGALNNPPACTITVNLGQLASVQ